MTNQADQSTSKPWSKPTADKESIPAARAPVSSIMTQAVVSLSPDMQVDTATELFLGLGISGAPVVDEQKRPIGVVSKTDLLREFYESDIEPPEVSSASKRTLRDFEAELSAGFQVERLKHATVSQVMMPISFTIHETATISQAAALMAYEGFHRVPVVSQDGRVVGLVSALDILRWLARHDGYVIPSHTQAQRH